MSQAKIDHKLTWTSWKCMRARCLNPRDIGFRNYGGRGIKVCDRWAIFANFLADMGDRPSKAHSIDRERTNGDYEPGNCKWATKAEQMANRRPYIETQTRRDSRTGVKGVSVHAGRFRAQIKPPGEKRRYLGHFDTLEAAGNAYAEAANGLQ